MSDRERHANRKHRGRGCSTSHPPFKARRCSDLISKQSYSAVTALKVRQEYRTWNPATAKSSPHLSCICTPHPALPVSSPQPVRKVFQARSETLDDARTGVLSADRRPSVASSSFHRPFLGFSTTLASAGARRSASFRSSSPASTLTPHAFPY